MIIQNDDGSIHVSHQHYGWLIDCHAAYFDTAPVIAGIVIANEPGLQRPEGQLVLFAVSRGSEVSLGRLISFMCPWFIKTHFLNPGKRGMLFLVCQVDL